jgi:Serine aminopeptidase, S33
MPLAYPHPDNKAGARRPKRLPMDERTIVDANGVKVFTRWWAIDHSRAVVLVSHGAEHSGRYDRFAHAVNDAGIAAVALDHRARTNPRGDRRRCHGPGRMQSRHRRPARAANRCTFVRRQR